MFFKDSTMPKCIYCLSNKNISSFSKTEHVIPQSFGKFKDNNLTLNRLVCDDCNLYFSKHLELYLGRDTYEGSVLRYQFNIKNDDEFKTLGKRSKLIEKINEGDFKGTFATREYSKKENKIKLKPLPQIGFLNAGNNNYTYYLLDNIPDKKQLENEHFDLKKPAAIKVISLDSSIANKILQDKGLGFVKKGTFRMQKGENDKIEMEVSGTIDDTIFRAIAKISFNYLAYWNQDVDFLLHKDFDTIRNFILHGDKPSYDLFRVDQGSILGDESVNGKVRLLGHIITVNWAKDNSSIISKVSLFNWITYSICLAKYYTAAYRNIKKGHFFNLADMRILELGTE